MVSNTIVRMFGLGLLGLAAVLTGVSPSRAETLSISATGLVRHCPCGATPNDLAEESNGVFVGQTPDGRYFVPVVFPVTTGQNVCSFSMVYQDTNAADVIKARLFGKAFAVGSNPAGGRHVIAAVNSANGVVNTVRVATTSTINAAAINPKWFYYIEVDVPTVNLNILGFQIVYKPAC